MLLGACGKTKVERPPAPPEEKKPPVEQVVNIGEGEATRYSLPTAKEERQPQWTIKWQTAQLEYGGESDIGGLMQDVTGTIYLDGQPVSDFSAEHGAADKKTGLLQLTENVQVWSREFILDEKGNRKRIGNARMRCDKVEWLASRKLVRASGEVTFETDGYTAGTFKELVVTPTLDAFGTPDQFPALK